MVGHVVVSAGDPLIVIAVGSEVAVEAYGDVVTSEDVVAAAP